MDANDCDDRDAAPALVLESVRSSERHDERGDGSFAPDIDGAVAGTPDFDLQLRAERSGRGRGREYVSTYAITDASENETSATVTIGVAHDQGRRR